MISLKELFWERKGRGMGWNKKRKDWDRKTI